MRTKTLIGLAALAAGAITVMAQPVYSLNVVGYVNYSFTKGNYTLVSNPLDAPTNDLASIIPSAPNGTSVQLWNVASQDIDPVAPQYFTSTGKWSTNITIAPGQGFFVVAAKAFTNTFVGNVRQGPVTNYLAAKGNYQAIGSTVPLGGGITNVLDQYVPRNGDSIQIWNVSMQDIDPTVPQYFSSTGKWNKDYNFNVGDGFFLVRGGNPVTYVRTYTVP